MTGNRGTKNGDEYDAFSRNRGIHSWRRGKLRRIKRGFSKRMRRLARLALRRPDDQP
ncbi:MAG: hypothetical protein K8F92_11080 [Hyphomicrobium sp.]|uniref:hypothetical protein n=1 Tax=Hyphomicrobium sp. TaxID=82 RepID=UPI0025B9F537|nr:hypothetical protein [Hyphomicrobium sp.]MBZ0210182.1 hypothetical protein [Hyphomicrobium sp.]